MADEILQRDPNHIVVLGGITDNAAQEIRMLRIDPVTKRLLISVTGVGSGTVTSLAASTGILLTPDPITTTGTIGLSTALAPIASLAGNSLKFLRVNVGETAVEWSTEGALGTVTSVSVVTANGVSGSVANATTTPAITLTLGAITPTSVNGLTITTTTGTFTLTNGKTLTVLKTMSFNAADDTGVYTLPTGTKTLVATDVATLSSLVSIGTITTGVWNATDIPVSAGGTGLSTISALSIWVANSADVITQVTPGAGNSIRINGGGTAWEAFTPSAGVPTTITVANEATDTSCFIAFFTAATGDLAPKTNANMTFNSNTGVATFASTILTTTDINGGTIDGVTIGGSSAGAGTFTTLVGTTINGNTFTTGTGVLTIAAGKTATHNATTTFAGTDGKTLTISNSITLAGTDATVMTFPTTSATIARTDAAQTFVGLQTFATVKITTGAGAGKVLTSDADGDATWETPSAGSSIPKCFVSTAFEDSARFGAAAGSASGTASYNTDGVNLASTATISRGISVTMSIAGGYQIGELGSPSFSCSIAFPFALTTTGSFYFGIGLVTVAGSGHTYTTDHAGFKILVVAGVASLYATQADGTTETASAALVTIATDDSFDLILQVNSTTSIDYYWRENGGTLSSATNLTTNMPSAASQFMQVSVSNNDAANNQRVTVSNMSYQR